MNPVLEAELDEVAGHLNAQHARLVRATNALLADPGSWVGPGIFTVETFLCWRTGISAAHARQIAAIAGRRGELPKCVRRFDAGEMSLDQMAAIVRRIPAWADVEVAELAPKLTVRQLQRLLGKYPFPDLNEPEPDDLGAIVEADDADEPMFGPPVPDGHREPRPVTVTEVGSCRMWFDDDGRFHLTVDTDHNTGELIETAITEARDRLFLDGQTEVSWLDGLREVAQRSLDTVESPDRRDRYRINIHLRDDGCCTDATGHDLPDTIRRYLTCDGLLSPVFIHQGMPISVGRTRRLVPERTRRLILLRDGSCRVPGCGVTRHLEVHHVIHWEHDGPTSTWNLVAICPHHHRLHHTGQLGITGNADTPDGLHFTDPHGRTITASGIAPTPPGGPPPPITGRYRHPLAERVDMHWITFHPPPEHRTKRTEHPSRIADP